MTSLTPALLADALEEYYTTKEMARLAYEDHPFAALVPKDTKWTGKEHVLPIQVTMPQGRSADFATAQANTTPGEYEAFKLTTSKDYGVLHIDTETIRASEGMPVRSFVAARKSEVDGIMTTLGSNLAMGLYRNGGGARGRRASASSNTITLTEPADIVNFEKGMVVRFSTADGTSGSLKAGSTFITAVDRDAGTFTVDDITDITSPADNDYVFCDGDFGVAVKGLAAWLPSSAPGATAFFGVDRSGEPTRLGGIRYSDSNTLVEKFKRSAARAWREGARPGVVFCNPEDWAELEIALDDKVVRDIVKSTDGTFGFESITLGTAVGKWKFVGDPDCPKDVAYALTMKHWKFVTRGAAPGVLSDDGKGEWLRRGAADGVEARFGWYGQLGCDAPGRNVRVALA